MSQSTSVNGAPGGEAIQGDIDLPSLGLRERRQGSWFTKLVRHYFQRSVARRNKAPAQVVQARSAPDRALSAIRWASVKSAITGAAAGAVSTGATLFTAETEGIGAVVAAPIAALAIGGGGVYPSLARAALTLDLATIFEVEFDADKEDDLWRLYGLIFGTQRHEKDSEDPGQGLVTEVTGAEGEQIGEAIGRQVLGESVMRNIVPFAGIVAS